MENILHRIKKIADNEAITLTMLEKNIGASKGVLTRALAKNTDIQAKWITLLVENYPLYSSEWILTGNGEMKKSNSQKNDDDQKSNKTFELLFEQLKEKNYLIDLQKKRISELEEKTMFFELHFPQGISKAKHELAQQKEKVHR